MEPASPPPAGDSFAARLRGFGPVGIFAILAIVLAGNVELGDMWMFPLGALLALAWVRASGTPWRELGYSRPRSWWWVAAVGVVSGAALKLLMKAVVMPLLGADPVNQAFHFLAGNRALLPAATLAMLTAGFAEETVFRGFLFERLGKVFGSSMGARVAIVVLTSTLFGVVHYPGQGVPGVQQATIVGLILATVFAATGRIWIPMVAHAAFDLTALGMIYWDVEREVAGLLFG